MRSYVHDLSYRITPDCTTSHTPTNSLVSRKRPTLGQPLTEIPDVKKSSSLDYELTIHFYIFNSNTPSPLLSLFPSYCLYCQEENLLIENNPILVSLSMQYLRRTPFFPLLLFDRYLHRRNNFMVII